MKEIFTPIKENPYPNGYFASLSEGGKTVSRIIVACAFVLLPIAFIVGIIAVGIAQDVISGQSDSGVMFIVVALGLLSIGLLVATIAFLVIARKRSKMGGTDWKNKFMKDSKYPESVINDFEMQMSQSDTVSFKLAGTMATPNEGIGFLTKEYIFFSGNAFKLCVIKKSDISRAYIGSMPDSINAGNKVKTVYIPELFIFSNHETYMSTRGKQEHLQALVAVLKEENPNVDIANGEVLSNEKIIDILKTMK